MTDRPFTYRRGCGVCPDCNKYLYNAAGCPCGWKSPKCGWTSPSGTFVCVRPQGHTGNHRTLRTEAVS